MSDPAPDLGGHNLRAALTDAVRLYMTCRGWTKQKEVAEWLGWSEATTSRKLKGGKWDLDDIELLAEKMDVGPGDLFGDPAELVALLRSRCFAAFSLVEDLGQMELALGWEAPVLTPVGA